MALVNIQITLSYDDTNQAAILEALQADLPKNQGESNINHLKRWIMVKAKETVRSYWSAKNAAAAANSTADTNITTS